MRRRDFIGLSGCAIVGAAQSGIFALTDCVRAQPARIPVLGILLVGNREPFTRLFGDGLREAGLIEGQNIRIETRSAAGDLRELPRLAAELVAMKVDVLVASETPAAQAAKGATSEIPIVMAPSGDPVGTGLIASLSRPGGNVTGLSAATAELAGKSLELIREMLPASRRVAALADPSNAFTKPFLEQIHQAARNTGLEVDVVMAGTAAELASRFADMSSRQIDAIVVQPTLPRGPILELIKKHGIPSVSGNRAFADGGGLLSYAASLPDRYSNAASYVDRILKGAKPADLPVRQPTKFELVVNLRTAKELGLQIPATLLSRADDVIE